MTDPDIQKIVTGCQSHNETKVNHTMILVHCFFLRHISKGADNSPKV